MKQRPLISYLAILVVVSGGLIAGMRLMGRSGPYLAGVYMFGPAIAALITRLLFYRPGFADARLRFGRWRDYLKFWGMTVVVICVSYGVYTILGSISWDFSGETFLAQLAEQMALSGRRIEDLPAGLTPKMMLIIFSVGGLTVFNIPTVIVGFGEEFGWRGLMFPLLCRSRLWGGFIAGGLIWFAWHVPLLLVIPGNSGFTAWQHAGNVIALAAGSVFTFVFLAYVFVKSGSIWTASFVHAVLNNGSRSFAYFATVENQLLANLGLAITMALVVIALYLKKELAVFEEFFHETGDAS